MSSEDELIESMAEAAWNVHATVPFAVFFRDHPELKQFYLDNQRAALAVVWKTLRNKELPLW